jgi:hypothetical protein
VSRDKSLKLVGSTRRGMPRPEDGGGIVPERVEFEIDCPNNHDQTVSFSQEEFEELLKSGALVFHCNTCDADWPPSREEIAKLRKQFPENQR